MVEIVSVVGGGSLGRELHLDNLARDLGEEAEYDPAHWPGIVYKPSGISATILIFSTGKYNIAGAESVPDIHNSKNKLLQELDRLNIDYEPSFEVRNIVYKYHYDRELNLEPLAVALGLENTEYEPEQFPGMIYRPTQDSDTFMIFRTGKILFTGSSEEQQAEQEFDKLISDLNNLFE